MAAFTTALGMRVDLGVLLLVRIMREAFPTARLRAGQPAHPTQTEDVFMRTFLLSCLILMIPICGPSWAGGKDPRVEIRPFVGYRLGGGVHESGYDSGGLIGDLDVKPGSQFGLMVNVPMAMLGSHDPSNHVMLEVFVALQPSTLRIDDRSDIDILALNSNFTQDGDKIELFDMDVSYYHVGGLYQWTDSSWIPYVNLSLGATTFSADADLDTKTKFSMGFGGGVKKFFNDRFGIRSQIRGYATFLGSEEEFYCDPFGCWSYSESVTFTQLEFSTGLVITL